MNVARYLWGPGSPLGAVVAGAAFAADQLHKWIMLHVVEIGQRGIIEVTPFLDFVMVWNPGVSYGLFQQDSARGQAVLVLVNVGIAIALWAWLSRMTQRFQVMSVALIVGGALGNALDRMLYGAVADFFHFHAFGWSWYVFNIADIAIVAGVAGLLYDSFRPGHKSAPKGK